MGSFEFNLKSREHVCGCWWGKIVADNQFSLTAIKKNSEEMENYLNHCSALWEGARKWCTTAKASRGVQELLIVSYPYDID